jgi:hypothetical protein
MFKYLDLSDWTFEVNGIPPELNECLERNLIKKADTDNFQFLALDENLEEVKNILGENYNRVSEYSFIEWIEQELSEHSYSIEVENYDGDKIEITGQDMFEIISEDFASYIDDLDEEQIYESEKPIAKLELSLNEIGRRELKNRLEALNDNISTAKFC